MTHQEIHDNEIIERYVRQKLTSAERLAFQEHFFDCDECFEQTQITTRFVAGVRDASRAGLLDVKQPERGGSFLTRGWAAAWAMPALALSLLLAVVLIGLWAFSLRRDNQLLTQRTAEQSSAAEKLQRSETKIRELEAGGNALQQQSESLKKENDRLKEELKASEREKETHLAQLNQPEINVPVRNIYPTGDAQRSGANAEMNQLRVPRGTRAFVLILGDYKPGYSDYSLEIIDSAGHVVAKRTGLKPDQNGELSVMLNRTLFSQRKYKLKLFGQGKPIAEYLVQVQ